MSMEINPKRSNNILFVQVNKCITEHIYTINAYPSILPVLHIVSSGWKSKWLKYLRKGNIFVRNETNIIARGAHNSNWVFHKKWKPFGCPHPNIMTCDKEVVSAQGSVPVRILGYQALHIVPNNYGHVFIRCTLHNHYKPTYEDQIQSRRLVNHIQSRSVSVSNYLSVSISCMLQSDITTPIWDASTLD